MTGTLGAEHGHRRRRRSVLPRWWSAMPHNREAAEGAQAVGGAGAELDDVRLRQRLRCGRARTLGNRGVVQRPHVVSHELVIAAAHRECGYDSYHLAQHHLEELKVQ